MLTARFAFVDPFEEGPPRAGSIGLKRLRIGHNHSHINMPNINELDD